MLLVFVFIVRRFFEWESLFILFSVLFLGFNIVFGDCGSLVIWVNEWMDGY